MGLLAEAYGIDGLKIAIDRSLKYPYTCFPKYL